MDTILKLNDFDRKREDLYTAYSKQPSKTNISSNHKNGSRGYFWSNTQQSLWMKLLLYVRRLCLLKQRLRRKVASSNAWNHALAKSVPVTGRMSFSRKRYMRNVGDRLVRGESSQFRELTKLQFHSTLLNAWLPVYAHWMAFRASMTIWEPMRYNKYKRESGAILKHNCSIVLLGTNLSYICANRINNIVDMLVLLKTWMPVCLRRLI